MIVIIGVARSEAWNFFFFFSEIMYVPHLRSEVALDYL